MIRRIAWDSVCIGLALTSPWWVVLIVVIAGTIMFPWYIESVFLGALFDALYGGNSNSWISHFTHTALFTTPFIFAEFIRTRINL